MTADQMINTEQTLSSVVKRAGETGYIAIDTEFVWERTYYPSLGIVQLGFSPEESYILDVLEVQNLSLLGEILVNPKIAKILHDAQQDLTILRRATNAFPGNIFDTRLAAGFAGLSASLSLSTLLKELLGVKLSKTETRSDWLKRPLTGRQIEYAMDDVRYLPFVRETLLTRIENLGHTAWLSEELTKFDTPTLYEENRLNDHFLKIKGVSKLGHRRKSIVQELARWREDTARCTNCPRSWIMGDLILIRIAQQKPRNVSELSNIEGLHEDTVRQYGTQLLESIERGLASAERNPQRIPEPVEGGDHLSARVDLAFAYIKGKSLASRIDPGLVATRGEISSLIQAAHEPSPENHRLLRGWRYDFVGTDLLQLMAGKLAVQMDAETGLPMRVLDA